MAGDVAEGVQAAHVRRLQGADHGIAPTQGGAHHPIHRLGIRRAALHDVQGLAQQGELQTIADEAGNGALQHHGFQVGGFQQLANGLQVRGQGGRAGYQLHQGNEVWRIPEVGDQQALRITQVRGQLVRRQAAGVAGDQGVRAQHDFELGIEPVLELQALGHGFEQQVAVGEIGKLGRRREAGYDCLGVHRDIRFFQLGEQGARGGRDLGESAGVDVLQAHGMTVASEVHGDTDAHETGTQDGEAWRGHDLFLVRRPRQPSHT